MTADIDVLARAHALFGGAGSAAVAPLAEAPIPPSAGGSAGLLADAYRDAARIRRADGDSARRVDAEIARILALAAHDRDGGRARTAAVLAAARADTPILDNPIAAREYLRRSASRLRAQRSHVLAARRDARRRRAELLRLRYRMRAPRRGRVRGARADRAVRAALSRLGCPYVWGAAGPDRFDCSGLVKWAYAQAGIPLHRTTYDQIRDGIAVARSDVRPGDLVFPHTGHVQLAIGNGLVVEAPHAGATVQISRLGPSIAIRRPV